MLGGQERVLALDQAADLLRRVGALLAEVGLAGDHLEHVRGDGLDEHADHEPERGADAGPAGGTDRGADLARGPAGGGALDELGADRGQQVAERVRGHVGELGVRQRQPRIRARAAQELDPVRRLPRGRRVERRRGLFAPGVDRLDRGHRVGGGCGRGSARQHPPDGLVSCRALEAQHRRGERRRCQRRRGLGGLGGNGFRGADVLHPPIQPRPVRAGTGRTPGV